ncbi:MAG: hypothetical protein PHC65_05670 [Methanobacteriaceae archaeon]|jgi:hypothetical protein|uniref:hypothetical protein n=1 Tax=unclassified Methanobrevibacter TaxID=2638681 RepID=UPI0037645AA2|nr:hypothetical protein [Methanobacteriaceae archaeon]MDD4594387.1 hypothetical protein [Methanobacteriaceae archaeon]
MENSLVEIAEKIKELEIEVLKLENQKEEYISQSWHNTDFKSILNKRNLTIRDKEYYIKSQIEYKNINEQLAVSTAELHFQRRLFNIFFYEKYNQD